MPANVSTIGRPGAARRLNDPGFTDPGGDVVAQNNGTTNGNEGRAVLPDLVLL